MHGVKAGNTPRTGCQSIAVHIHPFTLTSRGNLQSPINLNWTVGENSKVDELTKIKIQCLSFVDIVS